MSSVKALLMVGYVATNSTPVQAEDARKRRRHKSDSAAMGVTTADISQLGKAATRRTLHETTFNVKSKRRRRPTLEKFPLQDSSPMGSPPWEVRTAEPPRSPLARVVGQQSDNLPNFQLVLEPGRSRHNSFE